MRTRQHALTNRQAIGYLFHGLPGRFDSVDRLVRIELLDRRPKSRRNVGLGAGGENRWMPSVGLGKGGVGDESRVEEFGGVTVLSRR